MDNAAYALRIEQSIRNMLQQLPDAAAYVITAAQPEQTAIAKQVADRIAEETGKNISVIGPEEQRKA